MNANRMKYASTPTYGMQKRGLMKKTPVRQAPETPDFSKVPQPAPTMPPTASQTQPPQAFGQSTPPQGGFAGMPPYFSAPVQGTAQIPFASPNFIQPMAAQPPFQSFTPGVANPVPPLGNSAAAFNSSNLGFSPRSQGFVPPSAQPPQSQAVPSQAMQPGQPQPMRPAVQPAMYGFSPMPSAMQGTASMGQSMPGYMPQGAMTPPQSSAFGGMQPPPFSPAQPQAAAGAPQQPMFNLRTPPRQPAHERTPFNADRLWSVFLFGLLPLVFIPCLFVPSSLDVIRYVFLGLCVVGVGGMWYRQMFSSVTRLIVSMVYVALCIVTVAMMMQGGRDVLRTGAPGSQPASVQSSPTPDAAVAAAGMTAETPSPTPVPTPSGPSEAEQRLETFMALWQSNNPQEMVRLVQPSWASAQENPSTALFMLLANRTPEEYTIEEISGTDQDNSRTVTMTATINKNNGKDPSIYRFMVIMTKEGDEWYVDPNSLATNDELQSSEENVVNNLSVAEATATPRTTVTPAPAGDTTLYYNVSGGSFYHLDPYCSSVAEEYQPLTGTFPYSELSQYIGQYSPCLVCNAPTSTLD